MNLKKWLLLLALMLLSFVSFAQYPLTKIIGKDTVVIMTVRQGRQMNETFSTNEKTIKGVKDSLRYYIQSDRINSETVDTLWAKYTEMKYKFETNLKIYQEYDKKYQKDMRTYRTDEAILSAAVIVLSCLVIFVPGINFHR
jgi:hypothetical protein